MKINQLRKEIQKHIDSLEKIISKYQKDFDAIVRSAADEKGMSEQNVSKLKMIAAITAFPREEQEK